MSSYITPSFEIHLGHTVLVGRTCIGNCEYVRGASTGPPFAGVDPRRIVSLRLQSMAQAHSWHAQPLVDVCYYTHQMQQLAAQVPLCAS